MESWFKKKKSYKELKYRDIHMYMEKTISMPFMKWNKLNTQFNDKIFLCSGHPKLRYGGIMSNKSDAKVILWKLTLYLILPKNFFFFFPLEFSSSFCSNSFSSSATCWIERSRHKLCNLKVNSVKGRTFL